LTPVWASSSANAHPDVLSRAHWVSDKVGGHGAVREVTDLILRAQNRYEALLAAACSPTSAQAVEPR
jgi:3-deoxy-D-manno-octulosonate 8-phosphate phosphatase (KDO 8-P phosphatase)